MSFFEKVGHRLNQGRQDATQKVKEIGSSIKLNNEIAEERKEIANLFRRLGEAYYELFEDKPDEALEEYILAIKESEDNIADLQRQLNLLKSLQTCPGCGNLVDKNAYFCPTCGTRLPQVVLEPEDEDEEDRVCPLCGEKIKKGTLFCPVCGSLVEADDKGGESEEAAEAAEEDADNV